MSNMYVKDRMKPGQTMALTITLQLPQDMKGLDFIELHFKFTQQVVNTYNGGNTSLNKFGHTLVGIVNLSSSQ